MGRDAHGVWKGTIGLGDLQVYGACDPAAATREIPAGSLHLLPPRPTRGGLDLHYVTYGKRGYSTWKWVFQGDHPLGDAATIGAPSYLGGFDMRGTLRP